MKKSSHLYFGFLLLVGFSSHAQQYGKYTLYSVMQSNTTQLIDTNSTVFKTWTHAASAKTGYSSYLMPGGVLWRSVSNQNNSLQGGGMTGRIQKVAWDGTVLWDYTHSSSTYCLHHDFCPLPNGNVLMIAYEVKTPAQVSQAGASQSITVWSEKIIEVQPTTATGGTIVWEWHVWDHLVQNVNAAKDNYKTSIVEHPELINVNYSLQKDWMHMNGIDYNPMLDQIALSSHNHNQWYIIDHSTTTAEAASHSGGNAGKGGDLLYRYGNPASYGAPGSTVLNVTHDAHWIPEGVPNAGRLVGFNNKGVSSTKSSVDQIEVPLNGYNYDHIAGAAYQPTIYTQRHPCSGYSSNMGNSYQLPNGNMLVCVATTGLMYEISPVGTTLWSKTATGTVPQAFRYTECYVNNPAPAIPAISGAGTVLTSSDASTYQWYRNGQQISGATAQSYTATEAGIYLVRVTEATGCEAVYRYSKGYKITISVPLSVAVSAALNTVCSGDNVQLAATSEGGTSNTTFQWSSDPAGFSSDLPNPIAIPTVSTLYKVLATNGTEKDSTSIAITVNPLPNTPEVTNGANQLTSTLATAYLWYYNGVLLPDSISQTISPTFSGSFQVQVKDQNGCKSTLSAAVDFIYTSIENSAEVPSLKVFPNPSGGLFKIEIPFSSQRPFFISVYDAKGKLVHSGRNETQFNLTGFSPGLYRLLVRTENGIQVQASISLTN